MRFLSSARAALVLFFNALRSIMVCWVRTCGLVVLIGIFAAMRIHCSRGSTLIGRFGVILMVTRSLATGFGSKRCAR